MSGQPNAEAGPSTALFLKPPGMLPCYPIILYFIRPPAPPQPSPRLASTHDLLARFLLLPAYDKYVRPPPDDPPEPQDNGKGKAREQSPGPQTPGGDDPDDDDGAQAKGEKKKKNSYKHLLKGVPGVSGASCARVRAYSCPREALDEKG